MCIITNCIYNISTRQVLLDNKTYRLILQNQEISTPFLTTHMLCRYRYNYLPISIQSWNITIHINNCLYNKMSFLVHASIYIITWFPTILMITNLDLSSAWVEKIPCCWQQSVPPTVGWTITKILFKHTCTCTIVCYKPDLYKLPFKGIIKRIKNEECHDFLQI